MSIAIDPSVSAFLRSPHGLLIDGESGPARSGADMPLYDPATGAELARVARAGAEDVDRAVAARGARSKAAGQASARPIASACCCDWRNGSRRMASNWRSWKP